MLWREYKGQTELVKHSFNAGLYMTNDLNTHTHRSTLQK